MLQSNLSSRGIQFFDPWYRNMSCFPQESSQGSHTERDYGGYPLMKICDLCVSPYYANLKEELLCPYRRYRALNLNRMDLLAHDATMHQIRTVIKSNAVFQFIKQTGKGRTKTKLIKEINNIISTTHAHNNYNNRPLSESTEFEVEVPDLNEPPPFKRQRRTDLSAFNDTFGITRNNCKWMAYCDKFKGQFDVLLANGFSCNAARIILNYDSGTVRTCSNTWCESKVLVLHEHKPKYDVQQDTNLCVQRTLIPDEDDYCIMSAQDATGCYHYYHNKDENVLYCERCLMQKRRCQYYVNNNGHKEQCHNIIWCNRDKSKTCPICNQAMICSLHFNELKRCRKCGKVSCGNRNGCNLIECERCDKLQCNTCLERSDELYGGYKRCNPRCKCQYCKTVQECICFTKSERDGFDIVF
eukprot:812825_1